MKFGNLEYPIKIDGTQAVVYDSGVLTMTANAVTIIGLDGDTDSEYQLLCYLIDDTTVGDYKLTFNSDTGNNYGYQHISGISSSAAAVRDTSEAYWHIGQTSTDDYLCFSTTTIKAKSGYLRTGITKYAYDISGTTVTGVILRGQSWNNTADNITQMVITPTADNINVGSRIILLKKVTATDGIKTGELDIKGKVYGTWQEVYSTTLTEAATSVTISGLTGDTDVLYRLRARGVSNTGVSAGNSLRLNNDTTANICGYQYIQGVNTSVEVQRGTANFIPCCAFTAADQVSLNESIIYAKSGYVRTALTEIAHSISTTTVSNISLWGNSWNNTADEVTSMTITSGTADGIDIGTTLTLERLNL